MHCCGSSHAASSEPPSNLIIGLNSYCWPDRRCQTCAIDAIHIVSMLSINRMTRTTQENDGRLSMEAVQKTPEREAFYKKIDGENLSALWNVMGDLITPEPRSACRPHLWKFDAIRDYMTEAGKLITAKEAERRVLVMEKPRLRGPSKITTSLFAGVQMVVPGDVAPAHRHSQSALRFVLEGKGATTAVDGERTAMEPGDFVITRSPTWRAHANETSEPMFWLDGLDIPMVQFFDASFAEGSTEDQQKISRPAGDSFARYGHNLLPVDEKRT